MNALTDLTAYIGFLIVIIGLHEFGHFIVAKRFGLVASIFSLGFGRVLLSRTDKSGTSWQIRAVPLGGFIKLDEPVLAALPPLKRIAIYAAGPAFNIALGLVLITIAGVELGQIFIERRGERVMRATPPTFRKKVLLWVCARE